MVLDDETIVRHSEEPSGRVWTKRACPLCGAALVVEIDHHEAEQDAACVACFGFVGRVVIERPEPRAEAIDYFGGAS